VVIINQNSCFRAEEVLLLVLLARTAAEVEEETLKQVQVAVHAVEDLVVHLVAMTQVEEVEKKVEVRREVLVVTRRKATLSDKDGLTLTQRLLDI
jgi:hypothetical protein